MAKAVRRKGGATRKPAKRETSQAAVTITKDVPVVAEVDVLVVGAGIAGCVAAVTAARNGADVMLVERFGSLGGNMGPGMFSGGVVHLNLLFPDVMPEGLRGVPGEFLNRCRAHVDGPLGHHYHKDSEVVGYVWLKLMEESNVAVMLNTAAGDPILEGGRLTGMVLESRLGGRAVKAKVVIDATGDAEVAFRAGAPTDASSGYYHPGVYFDIGNVNEQTYRGFVDKSPPASKSDLRWAQKLCKDGGIKMGFPQSLSPMLRYFKTAYAHGEYRIVQIIGDRASVFVDHGLHFCGAQPGLVFGQVGVWPIKTHSVTEVLNELEIASRKYIFETAQFLRHRVPGFEHSYLHAISPYFHSRGGRSAVCEYRLTAADVARGRRFSDVVYRAWAHEVTAAECTPEGYDFPYRQLLPKGVDGLLMAGRSAIIQPPQNRTRYKVMLMGQAAGLAAALAGAAGVTPRKLDVKKLQRMLYQKYHVPIGGPKRAADLGLVHAGPERT